MRIDVARLRSMWVPTGSPEAMPSGGGFRTVTPSGISSEQTRECLALSAIIVADVLRLLEDNPPRTACEEGDEEGGAEGNGSMGLRRYFSFRAAVLLLLLPDVPFC